MVSAKDCSTEELLSSTGHLLRRAYQQWSSIWTTTVSSGLTPPQFTVLSVLAASTDPLDQQTIGEQAGLDRSTCGSLVERLERAGWIGTKTDPDNRRRKLVWITPLGRDIVSETGPQHRKMHELALAALTPNEQAQLNALLMKMSTNGR